MRLGALSFWFFGFRSLPRSRSRSRSRSRYRPRFRSRSVCCCITATISRSRSRSRSELRSRIVAQRFVLAPARLLLINPKIEKTFNFQLSTFNFF